MSLTLRSQKGSPLTFSEMDGNLTYLQDIAQQGGGSPISTSIVNTDFSQTGTRSIVSMHVKADINQPQGKVEMKGFFYSTTPSAPDKDNNQGQLQLGSSLNLILSPVQFGASQVLFNENEGLVIQYSRTELNQDLGGPLLNDTLYYFRPFIKFVDSDPVEYVYGNVISFTTLGSK
jgi:hypothetical protein